MAAAVLYSIAVLFGLWGFYSLLGYRMEKKAWKQKIGKWFDGSGERKSFISVWGERFDRTDHARGLEEKLHRANMPLTPSEFYAILIFEGLAITVFSYMLFGIPSPLNWIAGIAAPVLTYYLLFLLRRNKYRERLNDQLSEVCRTLAGSVRAGLTIPQGMDVVASEISQPAKGEFSRLSHNLKLGVSLEEGLSAMQQRVPTREFKLFIATLLIQKQMGGNLYAVLDEMAETLEDRKVLRQTIKTMTAEQRHIAGILPFMPVFLILIMNMIMEDFLKPLWSIPGLIISVLFIIGTLLTFVLVRKVTNIRV